MKSLRILASLALALSLGACSRSHHATDSLAGPVHGGNGIGVAPAVAIGCPTLLGNTALAPDTFVVASALTPKFTNKVLRLHTIGDVVSTPNLDAMGACATGLTPSIFVTGGHANVFLAGTRTSVSGPLTFGAMTLAPGVNGELLATDAAGNSLHVIWPALAGIGAGAPIVRVELRAWSAGLVNSLSRLDVEWDMTLQQDATVRTIMGRCARIPTNGSIITPAPAVLPACPATLGAGGAVVSRLASLPAYTRAGGLRAEIAGDVAGGVIGLSGPCAASATPSIVFTGGSGNMTVAGRATSLSTTNGPLTFGALLFPGLAIEPGVVIASDAAGNGLQIIWPQLAGLGAGAPILRLQLKSVSTLLARTGTKADVSMTFNAIGPDGAPATFTASARNLTIPALK